MAKTTDSDFVTALRSVDASPALRRELALRVPGFFDAYYAGMRWAEHRERWLRTIAEAYGEARATRGTSNPRKVRLLMLAPRDHGKTEACCSFVAQAVLADRSTRCLFICESAEMARKRLARVKAILTSQRVQRDWCGDPGAGCGPLLPPRGAEDLFKTKWGESRIQVLRPQDLVDPTVEAVGIGGGVTGGHFDLIVIDDPETYASVRSDLVRRERRTWLDSTVQPMLVAGGLMVLIGTRKHADDLYSRPLKDPTWRVIEDAAFLVDPDDVVAEPVYEEDQHGRQEVVDWRIEGGDPPVLWPEERPAKLLLTERATMGPTNFAREYQNRVVDDAASPFKRTWLDAACDRGAHLELYRGPWPDTLLIVQGWDPAFTYDPRQAEEGDTSYQVGVTWAADVRTRDRYLLGLLRERGASPAAKKANVGREYRRFAPPADAYDQAIPDYLEHGWCFAVSMEKNSAGEYHRIEAEEAYDVPILPHTTGAEVRDPFKGVPALASLFERGKVVLPYATPAARELVDVLVGELHGLGTAKHTDCVMAVWIAEVLLRRALAAYDDFLEARAA